MVTTQMTIFFLLIEVATFFLFFLRAKVNFLSSRILKKKKDTTVDLVENSLYRGFGKEKENF